MVPLSKIDIGKIDNQRILMLNGRYDPIIPLPNAERLAQLFQSAGAEIDLEVLPAGHELTPRDIAAAKEWLVR
jgi:phospholipase/carboxylesterase